MDAIPAPDWHYEMRRQAQQIVPGLFIGPYQSSKNLEELQRNGITDVLCITDVREAHLLKPRFPQLFNYKVLEIRDAQDQNLITLFPEAKAFIDQSLHRGGRVLVHCGDGISRSPAIVTAYVMQAFNVSQEKAFDHVQARRFCISPNQNFQHQLEAFQHIHEASLAISRDSGAGQQRLTARRRRADDSDDDEDEMERDLGTAHRQREDRVLPPIPPAMSDAMEVS